MIELLSFVQRPADSHRSAVDNKAEVEHDVGKVWIPLVILEAYSSSVGAWHAEYKEGAEETLLERVAHGRAKSEHAVVIDKRAVAVVGRFLWRQEWIQYVGNGRSDERRQILGDIREDRGGCEGMDWECCQQIMGVGYGGTQVG